MKRSFSPLFPLIIALTLLLPAACRSKKGAVGGGGYDGRRPSVVARDATHNTLAGPMALLMAEADRWVGTPYGYGGAERGKKADCSGMVQGVYLNALGIKLPRSSAQQQSWCEPVKDWKKNVIPGDLVFFAPGRGDRVSHVGIYIGDGKMVHASSSRGVMVSSLDEAYFVRSFHSAGRVGQYFAMLDGQDTAPEAAPTPAPTPTISLEDLVAQTPKEDAKPKAEPTRPEQKVKAADTPAEADSTAKVDPSEARRRLLQRLAEPDTIR